MQTFREWLKEKEINESTRKFISFQKFFIEEDETILIKESVITKIKKLYTLNDAEKLVNEFKKIFEINDNIKIQKVDIGGSFDPETFEITYSSMNSLIHELVHYLQKYKNHSGKYTFIEYNDDDCKLLRYLIQPLELNNWAVSLAADAEEYSSFDAFLKIAEKSDNFWKAKSKERLKHILYLLTNNMNCEVQKKYKERLLSKAKQYYLVVKSLKKDIKEHYVDKIWDPI